MNSNELDELELRILNQLWTMEEGLKHIVYRLDRIEEFLAGDKIKQSPMSLPSWPRPKNPLRGESNH